jgi:hypothetical protein
MHSYRAGEDGRMSFLLSLTHNIRYYNIQPGMTCVSRKCTKYKQVSIGRYNLLSSSRRTATPFEKIDVQQRTYLETTAETLALALFRRPNYGWKRRMHTLLSYYLTTGESSTSHWKGDYNHEPLHF